MKDLDNLKQTLNDCVNDLPQKFDILQRNASELGFVFKNNFTLYAYRTKKPGKQFFVMDILMECEKNGESKKEAQAIKQGIIHSLVSYGLESDYVPVTAKPKGDSNGDTDIQKAELLGTIPNLSSVIKH
ncbi:hypothetical protein PODOV084v1_p0014 [Vibrio phage 340E47.2]|nr:hypothetical protein PODOV084v1_p0014 [Vibrio phage 340E47.2]QZI91919.1 hypothetical protein PODOV077v1_p0008 [Vibrio phage 5P1a]